MHAPNRNVLWIEVAAILKCALWIVRRLNIAATSTPEYISGWCGHGFESHLQPCLLTTPG